jgi:aminoglycoside 6'-N-acetyltransferase
LSLREGGKLIGYVGLRLSAPDLLQASVTIQLNRAFHKQGLAAEAFEGVLRFCFDEIKLHRVSASCDSRNDAALKLLTRAGLRREGEFVKDSLIQGQWTNTVWHAILREEREQARVATA